MLSFPKMGLTIFPGLGNYAAMKLADYMRDQSLTPEDFANVVGDVSASGVRKWMSGDRVPRRDQMERIVTATDGAVMPNDFFLSPCTSQAIGEVAA